MKETKLPGKLKIESGDKVFTVETEEAFIKAYMDLGFSRRTAKEQLNNELSKNTPQPKH